jgi:hypothetical protein
MVRGQHSLSNPRGALAVVGVRAPLAVAALLLIIGTQAEAAPPTVVPSPGYDARLQEQRQRAERNVLPPAAAPLIVHRHRKRMHRHH